MYDCCKVHQINKKRTEEELTLSHNQRGACRERAGVTEPEFYRRGNTGLRSYQKALMTDLSIKQ